MGVFLPRPRTNKESECGSSDATRYGVTAMQGWRQHMEDAHAIFPMTIDGETSKAEVFGVFDGHGGAAVAAWVASSLQSYLTKELSQVRENISEGKLEPRLEGLPVWASSYCEALQRVFVRLDEEMTTAGSRRMMQSLVAKMNEKEQQGNNQSNEEDNNEENNNTSSREPQSLLHALLAGSAGRRPVVRIVEQGGHKYYQLFPCSLDDEDDDDDDEGGGGILSSTDSTNKVNSDDHVISSSDADNIDSSDDKKNSSDDKKNSSDADNIDSSDDKKNSSDDKKNSSDDQEINLSDPDKLNGDKNENNPVYRLNSTAAKPVQSMEDDIGGESNNNTTTTIEKVVTLSTEDAARLIDAPPSSTTLNDSVNLSSSSSSSSSESSEDEFDASRALYPEFSGTTAIVAVVHKGPPPMLIVANAGDSRAVLCRGGTAVPLSYDHKPDLPREKQRIENAGGVVHNGRIDGNLNLSRTLGDLNYKDNKSIPVDEQKISVVPDISVTPIHPEDEFVIIACDGIWDCLKNQKAVDLISAKIAQAEGKDKDGRLPPEEISRICEEVCDQCISQDPMSSEGGIGCDNMTLMVVQLNPALKEAAKAAELPELLKSRGTVFYGDAPEIINQPKSDSESD